MSAGFAARQRDHFDAWVTRLMTQLRPEEALTASLGAESSDFVRFNGAQVRQAGHVWQAVVTLKLSANDRQSATTLSLTGDLATDLARAAEAVATMRADLTHVPADPHLLLCEATEGVVDIGADSLPPSQVALAGLIDAAGDADLVGIWASGPVCTGFASSYGQRSFHARHAFHLDFSVHAGGDKAVKSDYAGMRFDPDVLAQRVRAAVTQLAVLRRPAHKVPPGAVRAWLTPTALGEVLGLLAWDSFGAKSQRTHHSALQRLVDGRAQLSPAVTLSEDVAGGVAAPFGAAGFRRPDTVDLIRDGRHAGCLVSPRSAREFGLVTTGAGESPDSLAMAPGTLPSADVLAALGTGVWVGNLWYTNWSDRPAGRLTGMTRFATLWVEGGEVVAPLSVMRFDDTVERILGGSLEALSAERELLLSSDTYGARSTSSMRLPGALLSELLFTL